MRTVARENEQHDLEVSGITGSESDPRLQLCLHELLEPVIDKFTDKVAIVCGETALTFREVHSLAHNLARALIQLGIRNGDLVGVALDRSVELIPVLLAVMKTGAAWVPIEPALPAERISQMMENACPKLVLTNTPETFACPEDLVCLSLDEVLRTTNLDAFSGSTNGWHVPVQSGDLAYVMYTSGSTGRPKGCEITHAALTNLLLSMQEEPGCGESDRLLAITTISFDVAVIDWFLPLLCGATTVIARRRELTDTAALVRLMERHQITMMQGTPAVWQMLLDAGWSAGQPRLNKLLTAGEPLPRALADRLLDRADAVWNLYGVTEASVYSTKWRVGRDQDVIIGGPIANTHLYILDENMSPVPLGSPGELCIGGLGVGRGYRNNSKLSRARFPNNPFHPGLMYRTGDVGRFIASGEVSLMGRMDGQVKIRGHRIELGDVEAAITAHEEVSATVVVGRDDRLVAYCVRRTRPLANGGSAAKAGELPRLDRLLRPWLVERLPAYMLPAFFVEVEALPLSINGKIDRKALPDPVAGLDTPGAGIMPASQLEGQILLIWSRILGHDRVRIDDNFFEIGGNSLRVVRAQKELQRLLGRPVSAAKLFEHYTIKSLAAYLTGAAEVARPEREATQQFRLDDGNQDIAVISMACRLPGGVETPEDFWELLKSGGDAITDAPEDRWSEDAGLDGQGESYCRRGGFIPSINSFDISFFGISPREASRLDPAQYMMLETCWEGFESAGYTAERLRDSQTGVFIGSSNIPAHHVLNPGAIRDLADLDGYTVTGSAAGTLSGRISYQLGLQGPAMTIDTACSSSLVTTHLACNALRQGECDMAVSGGIHLMLNQGLHVEFSRLQGMSPDGRCRSFSEDTQGTGWAEGSVVVILKRLSDAQRDGDRIHAAIRGTAVNHDGRSASLTAPSGPAQQRLIRTALAAARLQPDDIDYVETHGTATKLGDPIEATALAEVFGPGRPHSGPLLIGAAKSNIGHTQAASGLVGLLKVALSMQHNILPQTLHITKPTPAVDWQRANMTPVLTNRPWPSQESRPRRAGVSAFGIGGTNAHIIVEEPPGPVTAADIVKTAARLPPSLPFLLSGDTDAALRMQAEKLRRHISRSVTQDALADVACSLATTRSHFRKRLVLTVQDKSELLRELDSIAHPDSSPLAVKVEAAEPPRLAMLFTGQGSQWPGMGEELCELYPVFDRTIREIAALFDAELEVPLLDVMWAEPGSTAATFLDRTDFGQPALFALEVALWRLWEGWGVTPVFVLGHSLGELVAAHVAGIMDLPDACRLVAARGRLMQAQSGELSMVSLEASSAEVAAAIEQMGHGAHVDIAAHNTPTQTVISGTTDAVESITAYFARRGCQTKTLVVGHAFHSRHMDGMLADFRAVTETVRFHPPKISIVSSLEGGLAATNQLGKAEYWVKQARGPVRFSDGIRVLAGQGVNIFLELGPDQVLCGMGATCLADRDQTRAGPVAWLPSLRRGREGGSNLERSLAQLHMRHVPIDWQSYFKPFGCQRVQLPTYAFQREFHLRHEPNSAGVPRTNGASLSNRTGVTNGIKSDRGRNQFGIAWHPVKTDNVRPSGGTWGLVIPGGNSEWATSVTATLSQAGIQLVHVEQLKHAEKLKGLVCLWDLSVDMLTQTGNVMAEALRQLQKAAQTRAIPPLVWVTHQAVGTGEEVDDRDMILGSGSLLWGLMRTARSEHPELHLRLVDLGLETTGTGVASAVLLNGEPECAVRQDRVLIPRLQRVDPVPKQMLAEHKLVQQDGAVLITGGLGDLGTRVARWLASEHGVRDLVLTSRHGMDASGAETLISELSELGVRVTVVTGDVAKPDSVSAIMATFNENRPLRGVVHAAGVVDSGVLSTMTQQRCETTIAPKAYGAWNLHQATRDMDLDLFMMFSSISGVMGMPGLANYAAANTFLDALAHLRRAQGLPATSVAYGTWAGDGGMASRLGPATIAHLAQYGLEPLSTDEGLELFQQAVLSKRPLTMAAVLDLKRLQTYLEEQGGGIPPLLSSLLVRDNAVTHASSSSGRRHLGEMLKEAEPEQHVDIVLDMVRQVVAKALGFTQPSGVDIGRPLKDIGIDSLTAVQMRNHLATLTGLTLSVNIAFLYPNLRALSQALLSQLQETNRSSNATASTSRLNMAAMCKGCLDSSFTFDTPTENGSSLAARRPESVFLTGATGFVGAFILHELLKQGITTHCIVRADGVDKARQRLLSTLQEYGLWEPGFASNIEPVVGDIAQPLLGMTDQVFDDLAHRVDVICHSGGLVDWFRPLQDYVGPNIVSAHEILRLASRGRAKAVHLVSTISTLPVHTGLGLEEGDFEYGYGTSKYIAERLVAAARWRGARASAYRLPYVTASTATGHFRRDRGDFLHNLITGCLEMGVFPSVHADMSAVLPVDYLAKTIVAIMTRDSHRLGRDFDFLSTRAPTCSEFFKILGALDDGEPREIIAFGEWKQRALNHATAHPTSPLARISAILDGYTDETVTGMFKGLPVGEHVFGGDDYPAPRLDDEFVKAYVDRIRCQTGN
jgi:amino acid adenylation domain-containing protein/thioester reductase-like protein